MKDVCAICGREILPLQWFIEEDDPRHGPLFLVKRHLDCKWPT